MQKAVILSNKARHPEQREGSQYFSTQPIVLCLGTAVPQAPGPATKPGVRILSSVRHGFIHVKGFNFSLIALNNHAPLELQTGR